MLVHIPNLSWLRRRSGCMKNLRRGMEGKRLRGKLRPKDKRGRVPNVHLCLMLMQRGIKISIGVPCVKYLLALSRRATTTVPRLKAKNSVENVQNPNREK